MQSEPPQQRKLSRQLAPSLLDTDRASYTLPSPFLPPIQSNSSTLSNILARENIDTNVFQNCVIGVACCDIKGQLSAVNRTFSHLLGYNEYELTDKSILSLISVEDAEAIKSALQQLVSGEFSSVDLPLHFLHKRSHSILALVTILVSQKALGERSHILLQVQQVGRLRQFPEVLFADKEILRLVFKELIVGCAVLDFEHMSFVCANTALCDILGVTEDELGGHYLTDFIHEDDREKTTKFVQEMITCRSSRNQVNARVIPKVGYISSTLSFTTIVNSRSKPFLLVVQLQPVSK